MQGLDNPHRSDSGFLSPLIVCKHLYSWMMYYTTSYSSHICICAWFNDNADTGLFSSFRGSLKHQGDKGTMVDRRCCCLTHWSLVKSTTTRVFPACASSCSNFLSLATSPLDSVTQAPGSVLSPHQSFFSLLSFSPVHSVFYLLLLPPTLPLSFSFAAGDMGEVEKEREDEAPAVSGPFWVPRLCVYVVWVCLGKVGKRNNQTTGTHSLLHLFPTSVPWDLFHGNESLLHLIVDISSIHVILTSSLDPSSHSSSPFQTFSLSSFHLGEKSPLPLPLPPPYNLFYNHDMARQHQSGWVEGSTWITSFRLLASGLIPNLVPWARLFRTSL